MESSPFGPRFPVLGGEYELKDIGFRLVVWSSRALKPEEIEAAYRAWRAHENRGPLVPGKTFHFAHEVK